MCEVLLKCTICSHAVVAAAVAAATAAAAASAVAALLAVVADADVATVAIAASPACIRHSITATPTRIAQITFDVDTGSL